MWVEMIVTDNHGRERRNAAEPEWFRVRGVYVRLPRRPPRRPPLRRRLPPPPPLLLLPLLPELDSADTFLAIAGVNG